MFKKFFMASILGGLIFLGCPFSTYAVDDICELTLLPALGVDWFNQDYYKVPVDNFEFYRDFDSLLFLAEPSFLSNGHTNLAVQLATYFPEKKIVAGAEEISNSDYMKQTNSPADLELYYRISKVVDNTKPFEFDDNSFDTVVMRRGLCICPPQPGKHCCGGFLPESYEAKQFFSEVARVLNKKNPNAVAVLHGRSGVTAPVRAVWKNYLEEIEKKFDVSILYHIGPTEFLGFNYLTMRPKAHSSSPLPERYRSSRAMQALEKGIERSVEDDRRRRRSSQ